MAHEETGLEAICLGNHANSALQSVPSSGLAASLLPEGAILTLCVCFAVGIEFRVTEEYDEDSPFSRPPNWQPPSSNQESTKTADQHTPHSSSQSQSPATQSTTPSGQASTDQGTTGTTGNGSTPASRPEAPPEQAAVPGKSQNVGTRHESQTRAPASVSQSLSSSVGRGQVYSEADTPDRLAAGIELTDHPDSDEPVDTGRMDTVHQKPGLRRTLDGQGHVAPDRDHEELGLLPSQPGEPSADPPEGGGAWWESAATAASGAVESIKAALSAGYQSFSKGQPDSQQSGACLSLALCLCMSPCSQTWLQPSYLLLL